MSERMSDEQLSAYERCSATSEPVGDQQWVQIVPSLLAEIRALKQDLKQVRLQERERIAAMLDDKWGLDRVLMGLQALSEAKFYQDLAAAIRNTRSVEEIECQNT